MPESTGGLYRINPDVDSTISEPPSQRTVPTTYISASAGDLGIRFAGLAAGPQDVENGRYANMLFGIDRDGHLYAFNTQGVLQPIFVDGQTSVDTGISQLPGYDNGKCGGVPCAATEVILRRIVDGQTELAAETTTDANGNYTLAGLATASYAITATKRSPRSP